MNTFANFGPAMQAISAKYDAVASFDRYVPIPPPAHNLPMPTTKTTATPSATPEHELATAFQEISSQFALLGQSLHGFKLLLSKHGIDVSDTEIYTNFQTTSATLFSAPHPESPIIDISAESRNAQDARPCGLANSEPSLPHAVHSKGSRTVVEELADAIVSDDDLHIVHNKPVHDGKLRGSNGDNSNKTASDTSISEGVKDTANKEDGAVPHKPDHEHASSYEPRTVDLPIWSSSSSTVLEDEWTSSSDRLSSKAETEPTGRFSPCEDDAVISVNGIQKVDGVVRRTTTAEEQDVSTYCTIVHRTVDLDEKPSEPLQYPIQPAIFEGKTGVLYDEDGFLVEGQETENNQKYRI
ncbi:hypothetical protein M011DRAFT_524390 [Sporormia fimetaria CBS 119925]|uniref:Uncharacterized protein n=1 Tax=Sporormia fimetaria CBS 119925 TaxID=1340428 RepID=A0A6A6VGI9_9PLEO|nr:hypothetical protein M011DRAFT_524390 [Sporormia fimetaria CBS 119925]